MQTSGNNSLWLTSAREPLKSSGFRALYNLAQDALFRIFEKILILRNRMHVNVNEYLSHVLANIRASFASEYLNQITGLCY